MASFPLIEAKMAQALVECIPNFSEGRRPEVVQQIADAISLVPEVYLLDRHMDADHNRSVLTFVGSPEAVSQGAFNAIQTAAKLIDLEQHHGQHPRIGATDVVPFVPLSGIDMDGCVELARQLGARVGDELQIPVYLYEAAATRPERHNLEDIRRGEYEGLKQAIGTDPGRKPDFGPARLGGAGATVIGARAPLIAFNVYLNTDQVESARAIARTVRHSSGGLRYVKALGMLVNGRAQVSMNLTDFRQTPVARVIEMVRREAFQLGTSIHHSELVGLIPQQALIDAADWHLQLESFSSDQILETRMYQAMASAEGVSFLDKLAAGSATPGGGSAAAYGAAMAAALVAMVARLTIGKNKYAAVEGRMKEIAAAADELRHSLDGAVSRDAKAFDSVMAAMRLPRQTTVEKAARAEAIERATQVAARVPLEVAQQAATVCELAAEVAETGNASAATDAASSLALARAAITAAGLNVKINIAGVADRTLATSWLQQVESCTERSHRAQERLDAAVHSRAGLEV
jgi:glutamate formiminotransferase/formiminotetrahydrofolate cyclodeaminase